jgi:predicted flavoprotein YhiN
VKAGLLQEALHYSESDVARRREAAADPASLALLLKNLPITLLAPRPIEEAISSAGGVTFDGLDEHLMLKALPGVFCAGEMLDWEAPTGGYLLTASLASGRVAGAAAAEWIRLKEEFWQK